MNSIHPSTISSVPDRITDVPVSKKSIKLSLPDRIYVVYRNTILKLLEFLKKNEWYMTASTLGTLLLEPWQSLKAALLMPFGMKTHFNFYNLNPRNLTKEQLDKEPILCIHGNLHNQTAWLSLAKSMQSIGLGPLYTINVPSGEITTKDYEILEMKIKEIKAAYKKNIKIHFISHSRGGWLAVSKTWSNIGPGVERYWSPRSSDIGKVITMGFSLGKQSIQMVEKYDPHFKDSLFEIAGTYDVLWTDASVLPASNQYSIDVGHVGLLNSLEAHQTIIDILQSRMPQV